MKLKQLATFLILAYIVSWVCWLPLYGPAFGLKNLPSLPFQHGIGGLGPILAAFLTTYIFEHKKGVYQLLRRCIQFTPLVYLAIALFSPFILLIASAYLNVWVSGNPFELYDVLRTKEFPEFNILTFFVYNLLFFGFGEEVGWRGFALARFQNRLSALGSSIVLTAFWALWHWPLFFYRPGYITMDLSGIFGWIFSLLTGSILLTWLFNSSKGSILICAIFHTTVDIAFTVDIADKNIINYMGFLITLWGILTIFVFKPKNLARNESIKYTGS